MLSVNDLNRCVDILSDLNSRVTNNQDKRLLLELGYIIKQELELVKAAHNQNLRNRQTSIDPQKVLADNIQLCKENDALLKNIRKLNEIIEDKMPSIQKDLGMIRKKFDTLNKHLEDNFC